MRQTTMTETTDIQYPSIMRRFAIVAYDCLLIIAVCIAYGVFYIIIGKFVFNMESDRPSGLFFQVGWLATVIGFYSYFWIKGGETTGMRAWHVKITDLNGNTPNLAQCLIRLITSPIGWLFFFTALFDKNKQSLHDRLSRTQLRLIPKENQKK
jgi:uncharacterized RDD family membrane protein YckC